MQAPGSHQFAKPRRDKLKFIGHFIHTVALARWGGFELLAPKMVKWGVPECEGVSDHRAKTAV